MKWKSYEHSCVLLFSIVNQRSNLQKYTSDYPLCSLPILVKKRLCMRSITTSQWKHWFLKQITISRLSVFLDSS